MIDFDEKLAGILIPVFALRREGDLGIGDTQAVKNAIDFCARNNATVLQVLPINETGGDNSPYNAISSIALDPVLLTITPDTVPGLKQETYKSIVKQDVIASFSGMAVKYPVVKPLKNRLLREAFNNFKATGKQSDSKHFADFEQFKLEQREWLHDYALFRTLVDVHNGNTAWPQWPEEQRTPAKAEEWVKQQPNAQQLLDEQEFYSFVQWIAFQQWHDVRTYADKHGVRLMGDIPFGVSRYSADVWSNQTLFDLDWSGGAPPETWFKDDPFTAKWGQNWGLPLYKWEAHKQQKFAWWRQRVQKCVEIFHYFRIDHVLGFFRIYSFPWIPERNGEFLSLTDEEAKDRCGGRAPGFKPRSDEDPEDAEKNAAEGKALLEMILDASGKAGVVAEDLGMVPEYVRPLLEELGIPGFTIPYWEHDENMELKKSETLPRINLATWATHDHQPVSMFYDDLVRRWKGPEGHDAWVELQRLMRFLGLDENTPPDSYTEDLQHTFVKALLETPCWLAVFMISDLLGTSERFNQPGTSGESNWSHRLDHELSWYEKNPPFNKRVSDFARLVKENRRLPHASKVGTIR